MSKSLCMHCGKEFETSSACGAHEVYVHGDDYEVNYERDISGKIVEVSQNGGTE